MDWGEFYKWWHKHDNTNEFGHCIRQMTEDQLYEAWEHALRLQKNEKFTEAWPLLAMLFVREAGRRGALATNKKLSKKTRRANARKAARARWATNT